MQGSTPAAGKKQTRYKMATLNVTYEGNSNDICELDFSVTDDDIRRIAVEAMDLAANTFINFVIDRFEEQQRIYLRPKVPFG